MWIKKHLSTGSENALAIPETRVAKELRYREFKKLYVPLYLAEAFAAEGFEEWVTQNWQEVAGCKSSGGFTSKIWGCYICQEGANVIGVFGRKVSVEEFAHVCPAELCAV